jgi:hypothetical protein
MVKGTNRDALMYLIPTLPLLPDQRIQLLHSTSIGCWEQLKLQQTYLGLVQR